MGTKGHSNRQRIVRAADHLFYRQGYDKTSFSDIAAEAALSRGNFYYYFKAKDDILGAVLEQRCEAIRSTLQEWDRRHGNPRDRLKLFLNMPSRNQDDIVRYGCPLGTLGSELAKGRYRCEESAREMFELYRSWLTTQFTALGRGAEARELALHAMVLTQGLSTMANIYGDSDVIREETRRAMEWIDSV